MALLSLPISTQHPPLSLQLLQSDYHISVLPCCGPWPGAEQSLDSYLHHLLVPLAVLGHTWCFGKTKSFKNRTISLPLTQLQAISQSSRDRG